MDIRDKYKKWCDSHSIKFETIDNVSSYDDTTLFCPAGMQQYKGWFTRSNLFKDITIANIQSCIRMNDIKEIGDGTHLLYFNMIGLFSFRQFSMQQAVDFFLGFLNSIKLEVDHVTIHPDKPEWRELYRNYNTEVRFDQDCKWSDGAIGGYCTEFYKDNIEIGNIVNPLGDCIDVGFGLERLEQLVNNSASKSKIDTLRETISIILNSGYVPGPKLQGYVLRRLVRELYLLGDTWSNQVFINEVKRQDKLKNLYNRLKDKNQDKSPEWWYDTHGILI